MKDLYAMLGIPATSGEDTIRQAIERSRLSPAERDDAAYVLLDRARRGVYDKFRYELLLVLEVRARAQIPCTDNIFASGIHPSFAVSRYTNTSKASDDAESKSITGGCLAIGALAVVVIVVMITASNSGTQTPTYRPPPRPRATQAQTDAPSIPIILEENRPDKYLKFATNRYGALNADENSISSAAEMMRNRQVKELPKTGVLSRTDDWTSVAYGNHSDGYAPLEIKTPRGEHYFIKVVKWGTSQTALTAFIRSGETFETLLPVGSYEIRYASGQNWYGPILDFGPDASYARCDDRFNFTEDFRGTSGYAIELIKQVGGNLETEYLSEDEF